jgi:NAD(P)-dependent dehydrogenase (short-subunit alcohol dehydrogenase family)
MSHPALSPANVAVVTGGASGIGLAAARRFVEIGLRVCIADIGDDRLKTAEQVLTEAAGGRAGMVMAAECDVRRLGQLRGLESRIRSTFGAVHVLMNNAGIQPGSTVLHGGGWRRILDVNLLGVVNGTQAFVPHMVVQGTPGLVINTGSKQGITTPPGDPAYNVSKAGVKVFTEALQHELRNLARCNINAHLPIPGFLFTPLTSKGRAEKPAGAWPPTRRSTSC